MDPKTLILINPRCHQGRGWKRWLSIKTEVTDGLNSPSTEVVLEPGMDLSKELPILLQNGQYKYIVSAGGDGSIHHLVNALLKSPSINVKGLFLGAIGLGSSNDFLKPFNAKIKNIPTRINLLSPNNIHDVGLATYYDEHNEHKVQYFIVNASFGVTATANSTFNNPGMVLKLLQANFTGAAMFYTAVSTILNYKNFHCRLTYNNNETSLTASNINILKIPYVSGSLWYDQKIHPDDGKLVLCVCRDMSKMDLLKILSQLQKGLFKMGDKTITETINSFHLSSARPVIFECDGETSLANNVSITVVPRAINVLSC
jgi:diacylglycerol kinase family enzyme